jgi:hypothetical protein
MVAGDDHQPLQHPRRLGTTVPDGLRRAQRFHGFVFGGDQPPPERWDSERFHGI